MLDKKTKILILILSIIAMILISAELYTKSELKNSEKTEAKVLKVGITGPGTLVTYEYTVKGIEYKRKKTIGLPEYRKLSNEELLKIEDLKIKYSVDSPFLSEIIDERIN